MKHVLRITTALVTVILAVACSDNSPVAIASIDASTMAKGSGGSAVVATISLTAPAGAPFRNAKGKAKSSVSPTERELQVEVENVPAGTVLNVSVGGVNAGTVTANAFGKVNMNLNTNTGAVVPAIGAGTSVVVTTAGGATVVSGSF